MVARALPFLPRIISLIYGKGVVYAALRNPPCMELKSDSFDHAVVDLGTISGIPWLRLCSGGSEREIKEGDLKK